VSVIIFLLCRKLQIPKILLGEESTFANLQTLFKYIIKALSLAFGKETPLESSCVNKVLYPNNILGIEYLKALKRQNSPIIPVTIKREGAA